MGMVGPTLETLAMVGESMAIITNMLGTRHDKNGDIGLFADWLWCWRTTKVPAGGVCVTGWEDHSHRLWDPTSAESGSITWETFFY